MGTSGGKVNKQRMDEHDPMYVEPQESWGSFFWDLGKVALIVLAIALVMAGLK